jgi:DNA-binding winged helix-turn-helix (wHTH) protein/TolB-like protein/tetratricopeptide (TPR) repeat protein
VQISNPAGPRSEILAFDDFVLDESRATFSRAGVAVPLRPKAFALLLHLARNTGRVLSKAELLANVWPNVVVGDDSLSQCINEVRAALGELGPALIRTVARRGYRFDAVVESRTPATMADPPRPVAGWAGTASAERKRAAVLLSLMAIALALGGGLWLFQRLQAKPIQIDEAIAARATFAIMPLETGSGDPSLRNLADVVVDGIAAQFATRIGMRGLGRAATAPLADGGKSPVQVAIALNATGVVTGRITHAGESATAAAIDVRLEMAPNGAVVWSKHYEVGDPPSPDAIQAIGLHVVNAVRGLTAKRDILRSEETDASTDPAELTLRGWTDLDRRTSTEDLRRARRRFERALQADPDSLIALNGYAGSFANQLFEPGAPLAKDERALYEGAADRVMRLAPEDGTANLLWGWMQLRRGRPDLALPAIDKVLRLMPSYPASHVMRAEALLRLGRVTEVQAEVDKSLALAYLESRRASTAYAIAAEAALTLGEHERAFELARRSVAQYPGSVRALAVLVAAEALSGRDPSASLAELRQRWPAVTIAGLADWFCASSEYVAPQTRYYDGLRRAHLVEQ